MLNEEDEQYCEDCGKLLDLGDDHPFEDCCQYQDINYDEDEYGDDE